MSAPTLVNGRTDGGFGNASVTVNILSNSHGAVFDIETNYILSLPRMEIVPRVLIGETTISSGYSILAFKLISK